MNGSIAASGNIMSLLNFSDTLTPYAFYYLFSGCISLTTAPNLPAITMQLGCYSGMFYSCALLVNAPALPATTLADSCYQSMFENCTSLTQAPTILPALILKSSCYKSMFTSCTELTTAPALPAKELVVYCYDNMFEVCTKLNYVKALFTQLYNDEGPSNWLNNVSATGTFVKSKDATWTNDKVGIPSGWTVQTASQDK